MVHRSLVAGYLVLWSVALALIPASALPAQRNLDFEAGAGAGARAVPGWFLPIPGYRAELRIRGGVAGAHCVRIAPTGPARFGNFMQSVDAANFRGKYVRLRAEVRVAGPTSPAQLWMRVDRRGGKRGFFENMGDRPITGTTWAKYEIVGKVADDATSIAIGIMVRGTTGAWLDSVELEILENANASPHELPRPLVGTALDNVIAFARLTGYVRHFHPSSEARDEDWNRFTIDGVREVEGAKTPQDLVHELRLLFAFVAPTVAIRRGARGAAHAALTRPAKPNGYSVVAWQHLGFGQSKPGVYRSVIQVAPLVRGPFAAFSSTPKVEDLPDPGAAPQLPLPRGLTCSLPLALYQKGGRTVPHMRGQERQPRPVPPTAEDRATRLAAVILGWNVLQHFYPYFDVVKVDWSTALSTALQDAATDKSPAAFLTTLREMVAKLQDGHGYVTHNSDPRDGLLPVAFAMAGGKLVVDRVDHTDPATRGLAPGDVILQIDGEPARARLAQLETRVSAATPQYRSYRVLNELRRGVRGEEVRLEVQGPSAAFGIVLAYAQPIRLLTERRPAKIAEPAPGVYYVDIARIDDADYRAAIAKLAAAKAIVFDFRGYPGKLSSHLFLAHLITKRVQSARWLIPTPREPDRRNLTFHASNRWSIRPTKPHIRARLVFVTDGRAISYAESFLGIVEHYKLGAIVGEATAGTNGNINPIRLPGGYRVIWTGMKVLKHDGTRHHGIGILPTTKVERTIAGIRAGRDELLEKALAIARAPN